MKGNEQEQKQEQKASENENEHKSEDNKDKLSSDLVERISASALELAKIRKKETKKPPLTLVSMDIIKNDYFPNDDLSYICHSESDPGINCIDIDDNDYPHKRILSGGNDCQLIIYNRENKKFEYVIKGHNKRINDCKFHRREKDILFSTSYDNSCIVWKLFENEKYKKIWNIDNIYNDNVLSISQHPLNEYFVTCSRDGFWYFHSLKQEKTLLKGGDGLECDGYNSMELHPDGQILATGCNNKKLKIWDIRTNEIAFTFDLTNGVNISCMNFNENGYYLSSGDSNGIVNIWDLRKIGKKKDKQFLKQINVENRIKCVRFDKSGQYLAIGQSNGILLYLSKKWTQFAKFDNIHKKDVTAIQFAQNAKFIVTASRDRYIKIISNEQNI